MSDDTAPIVVTLKAGTGYDAPWLVIRGYDPDDVVNKLTSLDGVIEATLEVAGLFTAQRAVGGKQQAQEAPTPPPSEQPKQQAWGQTPAAQQQNVAPPRNDGVQYHPEGILCPGCHAGVIFKEITSKASGKKFQLWTCPNQRNKDDGHYSEFVN